MPETSAEAPPRGFKRFRRKAERATQEPGRVWSIAQRAAGKLGKHRGRLGQLRADLPVLLRLARAWARKEYRAIPWKSIVSVIAALLYFVSPVDLIPDLIPFFGFIDDAAVVAYVLKSLKTDLETFQKWEADEPSADSSRALPERRA